MHLLSSVSIREQVHDPDSWQEEQVDLPNNSLLLSSLYRGLLPGLLAINGRFGD